MHQLLHRVHTVETSDKSYSSNEIVSFKSMTYLRLLPLQLYQCCGPFVQTFSKHSSPEPKDFLGPFPPESYLKYSCIKKNAVFFNAHESLHAVTSVDRNAFTTDKPMIHSVSLISDS